MLKIAEVKAKHPWWHKPWQFVYSSNHDTKDYDAGIREHKKLEMVRCSLENCPFEKHILYQWTESK